MVIFFSRAKLKPFFKTEGPGKRMKEGHEAVSLLPKSTQLQILPLQRTRSEAHRGRQTEIHLYLSLFSLYFIFR